MIYYKTDEEIEFLRQSNLMVSKTHAAVASFIKPGVTGKKLDQIAEDFIRSNNAIPAFKGYKGFPGTLCISINQAVVHGIPTNYEFRDGDVVSMDCGVNLNGYYGDSAYTFAIGNVSDEVMNLLSVTLTSLYKGIEQAIVGNRIGDISFAIQNYCEVEHNYGVVRELVGHGIGKHLHEDPEVPNFGKRGRGPVIKEGLVIAIEPMINLGKRNVVQLSDNWTIETSDGKPSAHYEHSIAIRKNGPDILSDHTIIEEIVKNNPEIREIQRKS
jgi:methionyl aminopeptidase